MTDIYSVKTKIKKNFLSIIFTALSIYFCYHAMNGHRGVTALFSLTQQINKLNSELDTLRAERINIEHKVSLIKSESLDLDLVDEQARKFLGYADKDETIYFLEND